MPRKLKVDKNKLVKEIESGRSSKEIMSEFGIKTLAQLKSLYVDALMDAGKVPELKTARRSSAEPRKNSKELKVNKRGSLVVSKDLIEEMGFQVGDTFAVRNTAAGVSLKKM